MSDLSTGRLSCHLDIRHGSPAALVIRPEAIVIRRAGAAVPQFNGKRVVSVRGRTQNCVYLGSVRKSVIELDGGNQALVRLAAEADSAGAEPGSEVEVCWKVDAGIVVPWEKATVSRPLAPDEPNGAPPE